MGITTRKVVIITFIFSFLISSSMGFLFGVVGGVSTIKFFPQLADQIVRKITENKNQASSNTGNTGVSQPEAGSNTGALPAGSASSESLVIESIKKANPSVVSIIITKDLPKVQQYYFNPFGDDPFFNQFFGNNFSVPQQQGTEKKEVGGGSGFIVSEDGLIVTNKHVVSVADAEYTVLTNDEQKYPAKVLAVDPVNDLAIIKIEKKGLPVLTLGDSDKIQVGQYVITIGNALGEFRNTAGLGIVSGLRRSITASGSETGAEQLTNIIQTDATINPGNSGGPLINLKGEVIGVNVAMAQGAENIGFAIPVNDLKKIVNDVRTKGRIVTPYIGVRYILIDETIKKNNNLSVDYGALIARGKTIGDLAVIPGSPADKAGLQENDIILEVNGIKVDKTNPLANLVNKYSVGDEVSFKVLSKGKEKIVKVKLEERK